VQLHDSNDGASTFTSAQPDSLKLEYWTVRICLQAFANESYAAARTLSFDGGVLLARKGSLMPDCPTHHKFPEGSTNRDYDIFEEWPDGSTVWQACVFGMENVELKFRELAKETANRIFAISLLDKSIPVIRPWKLTAKEDLRRVS
jgi:hypothetical protein